MLRFFLTYASIGVASVGTLLAANFDRTQPWQISLQWDNDLLTGTDEGYTNGARIAFARALSPDSSRHNQLQRTLRGLTGAEANSAFGDLRFPRVGDLSFQYGIGLSQLMYTPQNPDTTTPPPDERPYAAWSGLEFSLQASAQNSASTATLSVGTTGDLSYGQDLQNWIHETVSDSPIFEGWDSQAPGELTLNLHFDHKRRIRFLDTTENWLIQVDGFSEWGASVGNFRTDLYAGAHLRAGRNLPESHLTPRVQLGSFTETLFQQKAVDEARVSIYGFAGIRGYGVVHDITLDGPLFRSWDESVDSEPWVGELSFGLAGRYGPLEVSLSHTIRSDEFTGQTNRSRYGSVLVRLSSTF